MKRLVILFIGLLMMSCMVKGTDKTLTKSSWIVVSLKGISQLKSIPTIKFDPETSKVGGYAGCNQFFGELSVDKQSISFRQNWCYTNDV